MTHAKAVHIVHDAFNDKPQTIGLLSEAYLYLLDYFDPDFTVEELKFYCEDYIRDEQRNAHVARVDKENKE